MMTEERKGDGTVADITDELDPTREENLDEESSELNDSEMEKVSGGAFDSYIIIPPAHGE